MRRTGPTRRAVLAAPLLARGPWAPFAPLAPFALLAPLALPGCDSASNRAGLEGGWLGASHLRGHALRPGAPALATPTAQKRCAVAIVGGGVAGLAAARALLRAGVEDIALFELEDEAGGNARSHQMHGMACPQGAHYLPLPGPQASEVSELLFDLGLLRTVAGRTQADERHLCHSPQERLWVDGEWTEGLLPPAAAGSPREAQYRRFSKTVAALSRELAFAMPTHRATWTPGHAALDSTTFAHWLASQGFDDPGLRWYLDYACRDDYGVDSHAVSAWAGLHYFASRHGFQAPGDNDTAEREAVFTWPEGNAWLTRRLAPALGSRLHGAAVVGRIEVLRHGVQLDVLRHAPQAGAQAAPATTVERWAAQHVVLAVPLHVAARVLTTPPPGLAEAAARVPHAPWLVANLHLRAPLTDKPGAPPSWDNVLFSPGTGAAGTAEGGNSSGSRPDRSGGASPSYSDGSGSGSGRGNGDANGNSANGRDATGNTTVLTMASSALGYVDAMHQSTRPVAGPTVLTAYWALGHANPQQAQQQRRALLEQPWQTWARRVLDDLARAHPDLPGKTTRVDLTRYGHAMAVPAPGVRSSAALRALAEPGVASRLHMAHSDLAGYSVFEEAYTLGTAAGRAVAKQLRG